MFLVWTWLVDFCGCTGSFWFYRFYRFSFIGFCTLFWYTFVHFWGIFFCIFGQIGATWKRVTGKWIILEHLELENEMEQMSPPEVVPLKQIIHDDPRIRNRVVIEKNPTQTEITVRKSLIRIRSENMSKLGKNTTKHIIGNTVYQQTAMFLSRIWNIGVKVDGQKKYHF